MTETKLPRSSRAGVDSWVLTCPHTQGTIETYSARKAKRALTLGWRVETSGQYLARINREIAKGCRSEGN